MSEVVVSGRVVVMGQSDHPEMIVVFNEYHYSQAYSLVMGMLWRRLNDHGKNWRHVYKVCKLYCT